MTVELHVVQPATTPYSYEVASQIVLLNTLFT